MRERITLDKLEDQEANTLRFLEAVDRADVRVVQRREHSRLALETGEPIRVAGERTRQDLDRDVAPELRVVSAVHLAHAARADQRLQVVSAERRTGHGWRHEIGSRYSERWFGKEAIVGL